MHGRLIAMFSQDKKCISCLTFLFAKVIFCVDLHLLLKMQSIYPFAQSEINSTLLYKNFHLPPEFF